MTVPLSVAFQDGVHLHGKAGNDQKGCKPDSPEGKDSFIPGIRIEFPVYSIGIRPHHEKEANHGDRKPDQHPFIVFFTEVKCTVVFGSLLRSTEIIS